MLDLLIVGLKFTRPACHAAAAAIDRHPLPAPDLSSKPADRRCCCCRPTGETDGRTDTRPFSDAYRIVCGPRIGKRRRRKSGLQWGRNFHPHIHLIPIPMGIPIPTADLAEVDGSSLAADSQPMALDPRKTPMCSMLDRRWQKPLNRTPAFLTPVDRSDL